LRKELVMTIEDRIVDIELKLVRQEDLVDSLNGMVYRQQQKIDELESLCAALARHIKDLRATAETDTVPLDEKPPHY
jgi:SlyX protein